MKKNNAAQRPSISFYTRYGPQLLTGLTVLILFAVFHDFLVFDKLYLFKGLASDSGSQRAVPAYSALGEIYVKNNKLDQALQASQKAVELAPNSWVNRLNLALVYQRVGRTNDAMTEAQTAYNLAPSDSKQHVVDIIAQIQQPQGKTP